MKVSSASLFLAVLILVFFLSCAVVRSAPVVPADVQHYTFADFLVEFGKHYDSPVDYAARERQFERTKRRLLEHNSRAEVTFVLGFNAFADLNEAEISAFLSAPRAKGRQTRPRASPLPVQAKGAERTAADRFLTAKGHSAVLHVSEGTATADDVKAKMVPETYTWQEHVPPVLTPVKAQGLCGSCWAHVAAECIESAMALQYRVPLRNVSVEQITSCADNPRRCGGDGGCYGGTVQLAFTYAASSGSGLLSEEDYPYTSGSTGSTGRCLLSTPPLPKQWTRVGAHAAAAEKAVPVARVRGHVQVERNSASATIAALLRHGPLAVAVDASDWFFYDSGIFSPVSDLPATAAPVTPVGTVVDTNITINHAVQLVGYGVDSTSNASFWIVRNSWGVGWGEAGYMRLQRAAAGESEQCAFVNDWNTVGGGCDDDPVEDIVACGTNGILYDVVYPVVAKVPVPGGALWWLPFAAFSALAMVMTVLITCTSRSLACV